MRHLCHNFDLYDWLMQIRDCLKFGGRTMVVWVGFSFLMRNSKTDDIAYIYAAKELSLIRSKPRNKVYIFYNFLLKVQLGNVG